MLPCLERNIPLIGKPIRNANIIEHACSMPQPVDFSMKALILAFDKNILDAYFGSTSIYPTNHIVIIFLLKFRLKSVY